MPVGVQQGQPLADKAVAKTAATRTDRMAGILTIEYDLFVVQHEPDTDRMLRPPAHV